jgi:hypothetical protein
VTCGPSTCQLSYGRAPAAAYQAAQLVVLLEYTSLRVVTGHVHGWRCRLQVNRYHREPKSQGGGRDRARSWGRRWRGTVGAR